MKVWNQSNSVEEAFELPEGRYGADFGFVVEQSISPHHVLEAATAIKESGKACTVASQAQLIVKAQEMGVAFTDWASKLVTL